MEDKRIERRWLTPKEIETIVQTARIAGAKTIASFLACRAVRC